jgi:hypothetical protein
LESIIDRLELIPTVAGAPEIQTSSAAGPKRDTETGYAFIVMAMNPDDHALVDVLDAIKEAARRCGVNAERIDDQQSNDRITDRILGAIDRAEFVIADLSSERPNVFYEAGYARGIGKLPIYLARQGTPVHFDVHDYPMIIYKGMKDLKDGLEARMRALIAARN